MRKHQLILMAAVLLVVAILVGGCKDRIKISSILNQPDRYMHKDVTIAGEVVETHKVKLIIAEAGAYKLDDGSGSIWVVTKTSVPDEGARVGLKGTVSDKIDLFGLTLGVVIQEKDRRTKD